jgi:hypothetical protein
MSVGVNKKQEGSGRKKESNYGIQWKMYAILVLFLAVALVIVWFVQVNMLSYFYEVNKFNELEKISLTIGNDLKDTDSLQNAVESYANDYYELLSITNKTEELEEDFGYFIDNENLLFVARNVKVENSPVLNVVNTSYLSVQPVSVRKQTNSNYTDKSVVLNGTPLSTGISADVIRIGRSDTTNTGTAMVLYYQNASINAGGNSYNQRTLLKMVTKLPSYSGAIVYSLVKADITL